MKKNICCRLLTMKCCLQNTSDPMDDDSIARMKAAVPLPFDHYSPKYRCCCSSVHVKQGTQIIGIVSVVLAVFTVIGLVFSSAFDPTWFAVNSISLVIEVIVLIALFFGLRNEDHKLLVPYLVYETFWMLFSLVILVFSAFVFARPDSEAGYVLRGQLVELTGPMDPNIQQHEIEMIRLSAMFTVASFVMSMIVTAWFLSTVYTCYVYLRDLSIARQSFDLSERFQAKTNLP